MINWLKNIEISKILRHIIGMFSKTSLVIELKINSILLLKILELKID